MYIFVYIYICRYMHTCIHIKDAHLLEIAPTHPIHNNTEAFRSRPIYCPAKPYDVRMH